MNTRVRHVSKQPCGTQARASAFLEHSTTTVTEYHTAAMCSNLKHCHQVVCFCTLTTLFSMSSFVLIVVP